MEIKDLSIKIDELSEKIEGQFNNMDQKFEKMEQRFEKIDEIAEHNQMKELTGEIRESFFCFEQEYGKEIDAVYDIVVLNKQTADIKISELDKKIDRNDSRIMRDYMEIENLKKLNSKTNSEN